MGHNGTLGKSPMGIAIICGPEGPGFFLHIFTKRARPKTKQKSHTDRHFLIRSDPYFNKLDHQGNRRLISLLTAEKMDSMSWPSRAGKILQRHAGQGAENEIEIDGVSCNGPGAREKFFDPIQAGQSAENEIEIALVSCTGSGSRAVQAKTK